MSNSEIGTKDRVQDNQRRFYKYMSRGTARIVLQNRTLRWSTPGALNDPYDMQFDLHLELDRNKLKALAVQRLWDAHYGEAAPRVANGLGALISAFRGVFPRLSRDEFDREYGEALNEGLARMERVLPEVQADVRKHMANGKILCLTEVPDNTLMWAHYAEQHQGVVLRFRTVPELDSVWQVAKPIIYRENMPRLLDEEFFADMAAGSANFDVATLIDRLVYTKSSEWEYEREWRIFAGAGRNRGAPHEDIPFHTLELDAIILGCRMAADDRAMLLELTRRLFPHTEALAARTAPRQFQIEIGPAE